MKLEDNLDGLQTCLQCGARVKFDRDGFCPNCFTGPNVKSQIPVEIEEAIRQILFHDWDPIGMADTELVNEYDAYIAPVYRVLVGSRSEDELTKYLFITARDTIGVASDTAEHFELGRPAARKLLELDVGL